MPSQIPTSFASAAAVPSAGDSNTTPRTTTSNGDWSRRPNGATQTFRRPSQINTTFGTKDSAGRDTSTPITTPYIPPHLNSAFQSSFNRTIPNGEHRYSKEQMLEIYKSQDQESLSNEILPSSLNEGWLPGTVSGSSRTDWNRKDDSKDQQQHNLDVCWDFEKLIQPMALREMDEEERELFTTSVNSPLKGPIQINKDSVSNSGLNGRKASMNQGQATPLGLRSERPGPRRRETSDSIGGGLGTPTFGRRDESNALTPSSALLHRRADLKDGGMSSLLDKSARLEGGIDTGSPFSSWKRNVSGPMSAGLTGPSSPWAASGPQSAGFGAFGNFAYDGPSTIPATPGEKRAGFGSLRGESRFKGLMSKDSSEDIGVKSRDKTTSGLGNLSESYVDKLGDAELDVHEEKRIGSAALLDDNVSSPTAPNSEKRQYDDIGFASFGAPPHLSGGRTAQDQFGSHTNDTTHSMGMSSHQNPDGDSRFLPGNADDGFANLSPFQSMMQGSRQQTASGLDAPGDKTQNSFVGPQRNFPPISGLGGLGGLGGNSPWSTTASGGYNQQRTAQAFGSGIFSSMADISSPGGAFGTPTNSAFPSTRSKMGALFAEHVRDDSNDNEGAYGSRPAAAGGSTDYPFNMSEPQSLAQTRNILDDLFRRPNSSETQPQNPSHGVGTSGTHPSSSSGPSPQYGRSPEPNQPPPAQQRQMVMPDRIRWIYRDPSGNMQGPFTGLEMHDWYKAGFFSPELQVKKVEEKEYEPLAQLIRRIGNSREPFLVPQIGIPHGPPSSTGVLGTPSGNANLGIQPPFGNSFPSFGTTLTADQQNALERRKQEEQILMARQKEHLQQQQSMMRNMLPNVPFPGAQPLHHQASVQSLHSHPSYGNISAPGGFINQPALGQPSTFDRQNFNALGGDGSFSRDPGLSSALDRLNLGHSSVAQSQYGTTHQDFNHSQSVSTMLQDRARLQAQQEQWNATQNNAGQQNLERLDQFHLLRSAENEQDPPSSESIGPSHTQEASPEPLQYEKHVEVEQQTHTEKDLTDEHAWREFAPQPSQSPLPAPAAQRNRQHVAEALAAESSLPQSPVETSGTSNLAPWAKDAQNSKVPSFQEIQEAEARKAAQQEEVAAAARRQLAEQERITAFQAATAAQTSTAALPSTANWATGSPSATASGSPWAKPASGKVGTPTASTKTKTLAQIQKEEESRKQRAAIAAAAAIANVTANPVATPAGKSYANLAGKVAGSPSNAISAGSGAWSVVGASGKAKAPASPSVPVRTVSSGATISSGKAKPQPVRNNSVANASQLALDAFQKWVRNSLSSGLNSSINVDEFVKNLISYPLEEEIISDAIYGNSQTLDGNRFAREFIQRKKEADKGKVSDTLGSNFIMGGVSEVKATSGGWNEVAKKAPTPAREEVASNFKVVAAKKKGKR